MKHKSGIVEFFSFNGIQG